MYTKNIDEIGNENQQPVPELVVQEVDTTELKKQHEKDVNKTQEIVSQFLKDSVQRRTSVIKLNHIPVNVMAGGMPYKPAPVVKKLTETKAKPEEPQPKTAL